MLAARLDLGLPRPGRPLGEHGLFVSPLAALLREVTARLSRHREGRQTGVGGVQRMVPCQAAQISPSFSPLGIRKRENPQDEFIGKLGKNLTLASNETSQCGGRKVRTKERKMATAANVFTDAQHVNSSRNYSGWTF